MGTLIVLFLTLVLAGCSDLRTPTEPDPAVNSLRVESVSASITAGDYRAFAVRVRVNETSDASATISSVALQFVGDGSPVTRTFSDIPKNTIGPRSSVELDDLPVDDPLHQLDTARTIVATITYSTASGQIGAATGSGAVPNCAAIFDVWTVDAVGVGESVQMRGGLEAGCSPMYYPLDGSQIQWRSLNPDIASVTSSGVVTGMTVGVTTIQGTYARVLSSHHVEVMPR